MPADVHTRQLRYFLAVAESGSFRHAARQLYVTQPALSRSIKTGSNLMVWLRSPPES